MGLTKNTFFAIHKTVLNQSPISSYATRKFTTKFKEEAVCNKVVKEAEKIVGYPTSFLSLRWLLNDEIANVANHIRRLIGSNHPLLATARDLIIGNKSPTWGLIVLLTSKAGGLARDFPDWDKDVTAGILNSQRVLAEVIEMIRTSNILHKSILNIYDRKTEEFCDLNFGNTLSLLSGDYLLSSSFQELAGLRNQEVNELVSTCLRDLAEAEFLEPRDQQGRPLPAKPQITPAAAVEVPNEFGCEPFKIREVLGNAKAEWTLRHFLSSASLLAKFCQAALNLANHPNDFQQVGYLFGRNIALAWHAHFDLQIFKEKQNGSFSLISAPVMFHLQHDPDFYAEILKGAENVHQCDYDKIYKTVRQGPGLRLTEELKEECVEKSLKALKHFRDSEATEALRNIARVI